MHISKGISAFFLVSFVLVVAGLVFDSQGQNKRSGDDNDATVVVEGSLTPKQFEHSKLYTQPGRVRKIRSLPDGTTIVIGPTWDDVSSHTDLITLDSYLHGLVCNADAVVMGTVDSKSSQLTSDGTFIFTDYELRIADVLKNNPSAYISDQSIVTVTRPGGTIRLNGKVVGVQESKYRRLERQKKYLLFLSYIPSTGAYKAINSEGSFEVDECQVASLNDKQPHANLLNDKNTEELINRIRALSNSCGTQGGER